MRHWKFLESHDVIREIIFPQSRADSGGTKLAKNTGDGFRKGQVKGRYQQYNPETDRHDKYDADGNYLGTKSF